MAIPNSPIAIANLAAKHLSLPPMQSITPGRTKQEQAFAGSYDDARQYVLSQHVWNFAKQRKTITRTGTPLFDYSDAYQCPNSMIRLLDVILADRELDKAEYDLADNPAGGYEILVNAGHANSIDISMIADVTDVSKWKPGFRKLVVLQLAMDVSYSFTVQNADVGRLTQLYDKAWAEVLSVEGQEMPPKRIQRSRLLAARRMASRNSSQYASPYFISDIY